MTMGSNTRDKKREELKRIWPNQNCFDCGKTPEQCGEEWHEIHHLNGDDTDHRIQNIVWACHGCNHKLEFRKANLLEREATPEMKKSEQRKPAFYSWLWNKIQNNNFHYPLGDAIDSGAYNFAIDIVTVKRWLRPLCSNDGPYKIIPFGKMGQEHIAMKGKNFGLEDQ